MYVRMYLLNIYGLITVILLIKLYKIYIKQGIKSIFEMPGLHMPGFKLV
jgi:hypothetical protein